MKKNYLEQIIKVIRGKLLAGQIYSEDWISGISLDSRKVQAGELFFALPGERVDGHAYVAAALAAGAAGAVVCRWPEEGFSLSGNEPVVNTKRIPLIQVDNVLGALQELAAWYRNQFTLPAIGVTGSTGKTTTKDLIAAALSKRRNVLKTAGNYNNEIGVPLTLLQLTDFHEVAVVEMAMRGPGQITDLCRLVSPEIGVITNIGHTHQELLGTQANIAWAKGELLENLPPYGWAVLNADDPWQQLLASKIGVQTLFYGLHHPTAAVYARDIQLLGAAGSSFRVHLPGMEGEINLPVPGIHNVYNALAAIGVGTLLGVPFEEIAEGLKSARITGMRLDLRPGYRGITLVNDCYNANPDSMLAALQVLMNLQGKRTIAVLGEMYELGDFTEEGHRLVGKEAARLGITQLIAVGKLAVDIARGAREASMPAERVITVPDNLGALQWIRAYTEPGDVVLVKGSRGMKMEEIVDALEFTEQNEGEVI
ncbi:MAG: UDP-N-acetylmuramoyl-tripeptide--D-alanyl-D-alanine ligase [Syntrophomonadaceae bacterium]|nr:UDP-N-acetylmuramoyl-tripeptide--D-alanyl-D-alanine ligase [Syntrophomonadaceae bacterium]